MHGANAGTRHERKRGDTRWAAACCATIRVKDLAILKDPVSRSRAREAGSASAFDALLGPPGRGSTCLAQVKVAHIAGRLCPQVGTSAGSPDPSSRMGRPASRAARFMLFPDQGVRLSRPCGAYGRCEMARERAVPVFP